MKPCKITVDLYNTFRERMPEYVQYDRNVPLEITVLENGKPADLSGLFGRLLVSKPDGHEVYSNDVEINGNVITTTLGEQVFTASGVAQVTVDILDEQNSKRALVPFGMRIRSAVITDESIKSSNDYQTITALISDVRALDAMFHVEQEQRAEAFNAQMQSQEATFTEAQRQFLADHREAMFHVEQQMTEQADMFHVEQTKRAKAFEQSEADREQRFEAQTTEWAQTVEQAEATRQFNEERRQSAENKREGAEKARESAERQRVDTEAVRQRQEQERGQGEAGRATAEANRVKAEQTRVDNESSRKSAESSRVNAESQRATAESHRATAETSRATAESQRATAETNRAGAEGRRSEVESSRVTAENGRVTAESQRVTAENAREAQENARREAEEDRATRMAQWEAKAEETAQKAQEAVDSAQAFVNTNEERLLTDRDKIDYWGNHHANMKDMTDATVDKILGDFNTLNHTSEYITATETIARHVPRGTLKGHTEVNCIQEPSGADIVLPYDFEPGYDVTINDTKESGALGVELKGQTLINLSSPHNEREIIFNSRYHVYNVTNDIVKGGLKNGEKIFMSMEVNIHEVNIETPLFRVGTCRETGGYDHITMTNAEICNLPKNTWVRLCAIRKVKEEESLEQYSFWFGMRGGHPTTDKEQIARVSFRNPMWINLTSIFGSGKEPTLTECEKLPYFTGMASVTTPTVTTTGKNLFNPLDLIVSESQRVTCVAESNKLSFRYKTGSHFNSSSYIQLEPNTKYWITITTKSYNENEGEYVKFHLGKRPHHDSTEYGGFVIKASTDGTQYRSFTTDNDAKLYINGYIGSVGYDIWDIMLEKAEDPSASATPYEPFKSSSLTLPEEIALRSLPNGVRDTYNVQTGEYVQRIGEITLDGNTRHTFNNNNSDNVNVFYFDNIVPNKKFTGYAQESQRLIQCDSLKTELNFNGWDSTESEYSLANSSTGFWIFVPKSIPQSWLAQNPVAVQYELETPIVTKVPSSQVLKSWNTLTHINTSVPENSLKPIIAPVNPSYEVMLKPSTQYSIITNPIANGHASTPIEFNLGGSTVETVIGNRCTLITTPSTLANNKLEMSGRGQKLQGGMMVLEGNKTGMIFGHFNGMKSVDCFTLKARNKNLLDVDNTIKGYWVDSASPDKIGGGGTSTRDTVDYIPVKPGEYLYLSNAKTTSTYGYSDIGRFVSNIDVSGRAPIPNGVRLLRLTLDNTIDYSQGQLEYGKNVTEFIPHQSNSLPLTIPMRSLPNGVCDTLDLLTGEYVQKLNTTRLTSGVITSAQGWYAGCNGQRNQHKFNIKLPADITNAKKTSAPLCDKFVTKNVWSEGNYGHDYISTALDSLFFVVDIDSLPRLEVNDNAVNRLKNYLDTEEVHLTYELAEPVVTQLDLQWEDGKLFAYDGTTHFFVDVEGGQLMPILDIDVPVNLAQRTSRLCAEKAQLEAEKAQLANEVSVLQLRNAMLQGEVSTLEQSNKDLQKEQEKLDKDNQELAHAVTIVDEHREEGDLELLSSDFDFELRLMEIEFAVGIPMMANYKGVRNMARTPYDMAKALILGGKYEREEMMTKLDRFEKLGSITADQKAELIALMDAVELTQ